MTSCIKIEPKTVTVADLAELLGSGSKTLASQDRVLTCYVRNYNGPPEKLNLVFADRATGSVKEYTVPYTTVCNVLGNHISIPLKDDTVITAYIFNVTPYYI